MGDWLAQINEKVQELRSSTDCEETISQIPGNGKPFYKVPAYVRQEQADQSLYVPGKISIGPYHHDIPSCQQGELIKHQCLINFLSRFSDHKPSQEKMFSSFAEKVDELSLRDMYDGLDKGWVGEDNKEAFVRMMVVDGCFLLEIMMEAMEARGYGEPCPHPVFNHNEMEAYRRDMLLLDNQIPLQVLLHIYELISKESSNYSGQRIQGFMMAANVYKPMVSMGRTNEKEIMEHLDGLNMLAPAISYWTGHSASIFGKLFPFPVLLIHGFFSLPGDGSLEGGSDGFLSPLHLLDVYRWGLLGSETYTKSPIGYDFLVSSFYDTLPSAKQLEEAQIGISPALYGHQIDISFKQRTGLVLHQIAIDHHSTKSNFLNTLLYERLHPNQTHHFSSYIFFMHCLLKDAADSRLLRAHRILNTTLTDEVFNLFSNLGKNISFHPDKPMDKKIWKVGLKLSRRFNINRQICLKDLFQKYLSSPWAYIPIFVGFLILSFTAFQTIYTVLGYYNGKK